MAILRWPTWGNDTSPAAFEKILSALTGKIDRASARADTFRQRQRRYKVLWTLYTGFAYILVAVILTLVTGWQNWRAAEYTGVAGGPLVIYGIRTAIEAYYSYRISSTETYLGELNKQRDAAIEKLKENMSYKKASEMLEKYGQSPKPKPAPSSSSNGRSPRSQSKKNAPPVQRTGIAPPPTANIPGRKPPPLPAPQTLQNANPRQDPNISLPPPQVAPPSNEDFAPNAFSAPSRQGPEYVSTGPRWYDRIMDVVLGDDETQPKNRIVLICQNCKLVNGQAPPGTKSLEDVGKWRCSECHSWNGTESQAKQMIQRIAEEQGALQAQPASPRTPEIPHEAEDSSEVEVEEVKREEDEASEASMEDTPPSGSTRSKVRQRKSK